MQWNIQDDLSPASPPVSAKYPAVIAHHHLPHQGKTESGPLFFGGKERLEHTGQGLFCKTSPIIGDYQADICIVNFPVFLQPDFNGSIPLHSLQAVDKNVMMSCLIWS